MLVKSYSHKRVIWGLLFAAAVLVPVKANACQLMSSGAPTAPRIEYDVYGFSTAIASTDFDVKNEGETDCVLDIVIEDLASFPPPFDFAQAGVDIGVIAPGLQRPQDGQNIEGVFLLTLAPGRSQTVQLDFFTDQITSVPAGLYDQDITISIQLNGTNEILEEFIFNLSVFASSQAQINIAGVAGNFDKTTYMDSVDFGEPEIGESQRVFVQMRSNAMATMTIRSDNGGMMRHDTEENSSIGYTAILDDERLDLGTPFVISGLSATEMIGQSQSLDLTIESLNNAYAGHYSDRIVIEIEAQ